MTKRKERIVLTLSSKYVKHWGIEEALRELYQNAFDRARDGDDFAWFHDTVDKGIMLDVTIGNYNTTLDRRALVMGESTKEDDTKSIGQFGEGFKLALLVLLRNDITIKIDTGTEYWTPKLVQNKQFGTKMLTIYVERYADVVCAEFQVAFKLYNVPKIAFTNYAEKNLALQSGVQSVETKDCQILLGDRHRGKLFIGDLYVCEYHGSTLYGYNFAPHVFNLGRDRQVVSGFDASWQASKAVTEMVISNIEEKQRVMDNLDGHNDLAHLAAFSDGIDALGVAMWERFIEEYPDHLPVYAQWQANELHRDYIGVKTVSVKEREYDLMIKTASYRHAKNSFEPRETPDAPNDVVQAFFDSHKNDMSTELQNAFAAEIMLPAEEWEVKS